MFCTFQQPQRTCQTRPATRPGGQRQPRPRWTAHLPWSVNEFLFDLREYHHRQVLGITILIYWLHVSFCLSVTLWLQCQYCCCFLGVRFHLIWFHRVEKARPFVPNTASRESGLHQVFTKSFRLEMFTNKLTACNWTIPRFKRMNANLNSYENTNGLTLAWFELVPSGPSESGMKLPHPHQLSI